MKDEFLDIISDNITCDTGNWGECGGLNRQSKIDAAEQSEILCKQKMKEFAEWVRDSHYDEWENDSSHKLPKGKWSSTNDNNIYTTDQLIDEFLKQ